MMMGDPDLAQLDDFAQVREIAAQGAQRQVGGADGHQRRAGHVGQHHRPRAREAAQRGASAARRPRPTRRARTPMPGRGARRGTSARSSRVLQGDLEERQGGARRARHRHGGRGGGAAAPPPTQFWARVRQGSVRVAGVPREPDRQPGGRRRSAVPQLRRHRLPGVPEVVRPHEDRRRHGGPARQARLPVREVRLRGAAQAQGGAPAGQDQGSASTRRARRSPRTPTCSGWCARTSRRCARSCCSSTRTRRRPSAPSCSSELGSQETDVGKLLAAFFQTDDQNFDAALRLLLQASWRRRWSSTGSASATR